LPSRICTSVDVYWYVEKMWSSLRGGTRAQRDGQRDGWAHGAKARAVTHVYLTLGESTSKLSQWIACMFAGSVVDVAELREVRQRALLRVDSADAVLVSLASEILKIFRRGKVDVKGLATVAGGGYRRTRHHRTYQVFEVIVD